MRLQPSVCFLLMSFCMNPALSETIGDVIYGEVQLPAETPFSGSTDKARQAYAGFLNSSIDSPHRATALRRLADLELEDSLQALELGEAVSFGKAVVLYRQFLHEYPDDPYRDRVLYQLSRALDNDGETGVALQNLQQLTGHYPDSVFAAEAFFRQAEMLFVAQQYAAAADAFAAVYQRDEDTRFESNARYKHGWSLFKDEKYAGAIKQFSGFIAHVLKKPQSVAEQMDKLTAGQREMLEDALHASSIALVELGGAPYLDSMFAEQDLPAWTWLYYEKLGDHYLAEERYSDAAESFAAFATRVPAHEQAPILQARVIETFDAAGFADRALQARARFVRAYGFDTPFWQGRQPKDFPDIGMQIDRHLASLTQHYHGVAQTNHDPLAVDEAAQWYRTWLRYFPAAEATPGRNFMLSELLFDAARYTDAAMEYERTAYEYPQHDRAAEAGYAALLARDRAADFSADAEQAVLHQLALDSQLRFADAWPADARTPAVLLNAAKALYESAALADAVIISGRALDARSRLTETQQRTAWLIRGHAQFDLAQFSAAEEDYQSALLLSAPAEPLSQDIQERLAATIYEQGRLAREGNDLTAAAAHFIRVSDLAFNSSVHAVALHDAAAAMISLQQWDNAATALDLLRSRYPRHDLSAGVGKQLAAVYLQADRPLDAAAELTRLAELAPPDTATAARWQAAALYADNNLQNEHLRILQNIAEAPESPDDEAMQAREKLLAIYSERGASELLRHWHESVINADAASGEQGSDYSHTMAARSALALATPFKDKFAAIELRLPLEQSLSAKKSALQLALAAYQRVAAYAIDETSSAATFHIAELYRQFGASLMASERPAELDELALEEYEFLLEEQAFPFEEKAIEIHQVNTARAASLVYDKWIAGSFRQLARLLPGRYNRTEHDETLVTQLD
ncbi:MAG: hypothetical protein HKM98_03850 [Gammaproteobacteria bacterium]|nr:hypothetical protein [Gammaproteobacteria bacterium]